MALKWWQTEDIIQRESTLTRNKAESLLSKLATQERLRQEQEEAEALEQGKIPGRQMTAYLKSVQRWRAADEINAANEKLKDLGIPWSNLIPVSESTIQSQIMSGRTWTNQYVKEVEAETRQDRLDEVVKEAKEWAKWEARQAGANWADYNPQQQQEFIDEQTARILGERYPGEFDIPVLPTQKPPTEEGWQMPGLGLMEGKGTTVETEVPEIPKEGVEIGEGLLLMPDYSVVSNNRTIGSIDPETGEFIEKEKSWWEKAGDILKWLPPNIPATLIEKYGFAAIEKADLPFMIQEQAHTLNEAVKSNAVLTEEQQKFYDLYKEEVGEPPDYNEILSALHPAVRMTEMWKGVKSPSEELKQAYYESTGTATQMLHGLATPLSIGLLAAGGLGGATALESRLAQVVTKGGRVGKLAQVGQIAAAPVVGVEWGIGQILSKTLGQFPKLAARASEAVAKRNFATSNGGRRIITMVGKDSPQYKALYKIWRLNQKKPPTGQPASFYQEQAIKEFGYQYRTDKIFREMVDDMAGVPKGKTPTGQPPTTKPVLPSGTKPTGVGVLAAPAKEVPVAVKPTAPAVETTAKEPWMMTQSQYVSAFEGKPQFVEKGINTPADVHEYLIKQALSEGKPVPAEVLKGYPDLAKVTPEVTKSIQSFRDAIVGELETVKNQYRLGEITNAEFLAKQRGIAERAIKAETSNVAKEQWQRILKRTEAETTALATGETVTGEVSTEGYEVTVEGLEPVRNIRKLQSQYVARRIEYDAAKKQLVDYVKENLPKEVQGKMLASVKNVRTEAGLQKAIALADKYAEQAAQKTLRTKITNELRKTKTTRTATGFRYGRFTAETQRQLNAIKKNTLMDRETAKAEILKNIEAAEEGKITYEQADEANEILQVSGLKGMSSDELAHTLREIKSLKETGRGLRAAEKEAETERITKVREDVINTVTGGKGIKPGVGTVDTRGMEVQQGKLHDFVTNWQYGFHDILDVLSKYDKGSKPYQSIISQIGNRIQLSRSTQDLGVAHYLEHSMPNKIREIYDLKNFKEVYHLLNRMADEKINLGAFVTTEGETLTLELSKGQIIDKYLQLQDPTLEDTFRTGMKWTDEMMNAVRNSMSDEDLEYAKWLLNFYQEYGKTIKSAFEVKYHIPFPENPNYSPLARDLESGRYEHILLARDNFRYAGISNNSLKARIKNRIPLRFNDATAILVNHITQMEHFKAFASSMKEARMVFGNKEVRTAIRQYHGQKVLSHLDRHLNDIARDGVDKALLTRQVDKLRQRFTLASLGIKPGVAIKQVFSLPAYMTYEQMPLADFFTGVADFWKAPLAHVREMKQLSGHLSERWGHGHERDIRLVMKKGYAGQLTNARNWRDILMLPIRGFDMAATMQGSWSVYQSMLKQGLSKEQAILHAELATDRTQPSFGLEDMAALRKHNSYLRLLTMFQSQPNKYYRIIASSIRNLKAGRGDKKRHILNLMLAWFVLPMLFQYATDAFQWKKWHQVRAAALGPANYLLAAGQLVQSIYGWITNEPFTYEVSPVFDTFNEMQWAIQGVGKLIEQGKDPTKEIDPEYLGKVIEHIALAAGQLTGMPTPYAKQIERAIRNADIKQMVFTEYALKNEEDAVKKLQDTYAQGVYGKDSWKDLTDEEQNRFYELRPDLR